MSSVNKKRSLFSSYNERLLLRWVLHTRTWYCVGFLLLIPLFFLSVQRAESYGSPGQPIGFVSDFTHLFSADQVSVLESRLREYEKKTTNEISIVTIPTLGADSIEYYATTLFNEWGIGKTDKNNGILILISPSDRLMRIEVGDGLTSVLTNGVAQEIINTLLRPAFHSGDYYGGVTSALDRITDVIAGIYTPMAHISGDAPFDSDLQLEKGLRFGAAALFIVIVSILLRLYYTHIGLRSRRSVIPEYEPPQNIRPAMAEFLMKQKNTSRAWSATIVDLAVRGYVSISDKKASTIPAKKTSVVGKVIVSALGLFILFVVIFPIISSFITLLGFLFSARSDPYETFIVLIVVCSLFFSSRVRDSLKYLIPKTYVITKKKEFINDSALEDFEKEFLGILFEHGDTFLTSGKSADERKEYSYFRKFHGLRSRLREEIFHDTRAFTKTPKERTNNLPLFIGLLPFVMISTFIGGVMVRSLLKIEIGYVFLTVAFLYALTILLTIKQDENLSKEGELLRDDWYGFKLYLETAERYRLQNLTPELFQKFLPYAMIFGVEKSWNKAFGKIEHLDWYDGDISHFSSSSLSRSLSNSFALRGAAGASFSSGGGSFGGGHSSGGGASGSW